MDQYQSPELRLQHLQKHRPCERYCPTCKQWKHHSRFSSKKRITPNGTVWEFDDECRDCQQKKRNEKKNLDRPKAIIEARASAIATKAGKSRDFFMVQMNYRSLISVLRVLMTPEGLCQGCGHEFVNERDIQIDHILPPRSIQDWARLHARNIRLGCGSCNNTKNDKPFEEWLDEQEGARLSHLEESEKFLNDRDVHFEEGELFFGI